MKKVVPFWVYASALDAERTGFPARWHYLADFPSKSADMVPDAPEHSDRNDISPEAMTARLHHRWQGRSPAVWATRTHLP